jgi:hypothetical protein
MHQSAFQLLPTFFDSSTLLFKLLFSHFLFTFSSTEHISFSIRPTSEIPIFDQRNMTDEEKELLARIGQLAGKSAANLMHCAPLTFNRPDQSTQEQAGRRSTITESASCSSSKSVFARPTNECSHTDTLQAMHTATTPDPTQALIELDGHNRIGTVHFS